MSDAQKLLDECSLTDTEMVDINISKLCKGSLARKPMDTTFSKKVTKFKRNYGLTMVECNE